MNSKAIRRVSWPLSIFRTRASGRRLLSIDTGYSMEMIWDRKMEHEITCRDLDGFFDHVWNVHPAVGASTEHSPATAVGSPITFQITPRHTVIEGKVAQFKWLTSCPRLNFAISQTVLVLRLLRLICAEDITIIRVSDPFYTGILGLLLARATRVPLVIRVNANEDYMYESTGEVAFPRALPSRALEQRVSRFLLKRADLVAAGNENNRQFALANGAPPERSTLFRCGTWVDSLHFGNDPGQRPSVRSDVGLGDRPFIILVSRLEPVKHPDDVLRVLARCKAKIPDLAAVFVGDGTMRGELEAAAADMGLTDDVRFTGYRDQGWISGALSCASVVLSPLTGRALVEACLSGTPVVAYDVEWHSELVTTGDTGILVPYRDIVAMADAVMSLIADPTFSMALGRKARSVTLEMMDPPRLMEHERSEYVELLRRKGHPLLLPEPRSGSIIAST